MLLSFKTHLKKFQANNFKVTFPETEVQGRPRSSSSTNLPAPKPKDTYRRHLFCDYRTSVTKEDIRVSLSEPKHSFRVSTSEGFQGTTSQSYANLHNLSLPTLFTTLQKKRTSDCLSSAATKYQTMALGRLQAREFQSLLLETLQMKKNNSRSSMSLNSILKLWNSYPFMKIYIPHMTLKIGVHSGNVLHFCHTQTVLPYTRNTWALSNACICISFSYLSAENVGLHCGR